MFAAALVLGMVGANYAAGGVEVLRVMVVSLVMDVNRVYFAIKRI